MRPDRLPEHVNVTIANPGVAKLETKLSELGLALAASHSALSKKLVLILESIGSGNDPEVVAKIRAQTAKLKADSDKLEEAVRLHSTEGQG